MTASAIKILFLSQTAADPAGESIVQFMQQLALPVVCADLNNGVVESLEGRTDMSFVIVMNGPPAGGANAGAVSDQVLFKLGYCAGKMGLKRMCMMDSSAHGESSDAHGIAHVAFDAGGGWQLALARQMKRAGLEIDLNKLA
jgi:predicted nucleotide-binding protein